MQWKPTLQLTATVEPFLPTPPVKITVKMLTNDIVAQTAVIKIVPNRSSMKSKFPI